MTECMKFWLKELYLSAADEHLEAAKNEHLWTLDSDTDADAMLHERNADEHRAFANVLNTMANNIEEDVSYG